jgi:cytochrome c-type biogenesis protein CcmH/NrfG
VCDPEPEQREEAAKLQLLYCLQQIDGLRAHAAQNPGNYDAWLAFGEIALEIALRTNGEEAHSYLVEVCCATCHQHIVPHPTLFLQSLQAFQNAINLDPTRTEAIVQ